MTLNWTASLLGTLCTHIPSPSHLLHKRMKKRCGSVCILQHCACIHTGLDEELTSQHETCSTRHTIQGTHNTLCCRYIKNRIEPWNTWNRWNFIFIISLPGPRGTKLGVVSTFWLFFYYCKVQLVVFSNFDTRVVVWYSYIIFLHCPHCPQYADCCKGAEG